MIDQDLIRKAAEAMWSTYSRGYKCGPMGILIASGKDEPIPFDPLDEHVKKHWQKLATAALTVFYEHTRAQTRERKPLLCPDCNGTMKPTLTNPAIMVCSNCGKSL